jgi:hypothetical protein
VLVYGSFTVAPDAATAMITAAAIAASMVIA